MKYALIFSVAFGAILMFLLAAASGNTALFSRHYALLLGLNAALAAALAALIGYQLWVLTAKLRKHVFGSRLTLRFLLMFLPMVIVPGGLVYVVSLQFMAKSIESWFDVRVDNALEGGLNLGRTALDLLLTELHDKARRMALELSDKKPGAAGGAARPAARTGGRRRCAAVVLGRQCHRQRKQARGQTPARPAQHHHPAPGAAKPAVTPRSRATQTRACACACWFR